jgi:ADP-ribosylglycohydrolase
MLSDDTEHSVFVAQSLIAHPDSADAFARRLAWCLRAWLLSLPAGVGFATLRATCKLWLGWPVRSSGVWSAGNGPAMRVAPIGAFFAHAPERLEAYVRASTALTHRDPRATTGATIVARLAAWCVREGLLERPPVERFSEVLRGAGGDDEWNSIVTGIEQAAREDLPVPELARRLGLGDGVTGYVHHTVAIGAYAWFRHFGDFRASLIAVLDCGGDTDTTGAIVGALSGVTVGESGIPQSWVGGLADWPRSAPLLRKLADRLARASAGEPAAPVRYFWPGVLPRNAVFLLLVLAHGLRRLFPPYR